LALSRLRARLAAWFAIAFLAGLTVLDLSLYLYLRVAASRRLTADLRGTAEELARAVELELSESPGRSLAVATREALREWPARAGGYIVVDSAGVVLAEQGPPGWLEASRRAPLTATMSDLSSGPDDPIRRVVRWQAGPPRFATVVLGSSEATEEQSKTLALWLALSTPLVLLLGLGGGYILSRRALAPVDRLRDAIGAISPTTLGRRLTVAPVPDELDRLAMQFNALLDRLETSQQQNRRFLRQAAHQIRTPLTLVVGEASLELQREQGSATPALRRIRVAAEQMQRRVNDLFLLAEARAGGVPPLDERVELDGLLLEAADVMRGRAHQLGRKLELDGVNPVSVSGNRALLQEAVVELVENGLRHGDPTMPVALGVESSGGTVRLTVASGGTPLPLLEAEPDPIESDAEHGLGLTIVQWIARLHGGSLEVNRVEEVNRVTLVLPHEATVNSNTGSRLQVVPSE
jgi:signal transduction histidine kinase